MDPGGIEVEWIFARDRGKIIVSYTYMDIIVRGGFYSLLSCKSAQTSKRLNAYAEVLCWVIIHYAVL